MAAEADRVVVELIAQNDQFDANVKTSAATYQQGMGQIVTAAGGAEKAHGRMTLAMNNNRIAMLEFQKVARGTTDQIAAGAPLTQILTGHLGELAEAVELAGGSFGKFGAFLGGPWGIALTLATSLLVSLIASHQGAKDAADKHASAEETLTNFLNGQRVATDALVESLKKLNEQENKSLETTNEQIRARYDLVNATLAQLQANRATLAGELAAAQTRLGSAQAQQRSAAGPGEMELAGGAVASAQAEVDRLAHELANVTQSIGLASATIDTELTKLARGLQTHVDRVNDDFDKQRLALEAKYRGTETKRGDQTVLAGGLFNQPGITDAKRQQLLQQLTQQEEKLNVTRAKSVEAARKLDEAEQGRSSKGAGDFGKQITFADAEAIARTAGLTVTSGYRSTAHQADLYNDPRYNHPGNPVARPGTSAHEGVNGKWALDIAFAPGITAQSLKRLYGDQGVTLSAIYKESGHYHIEGSRSQAAAADSAAQRLANSQAKSDDSFKTEGDRIDAETLKTREQLLTGYAERADIQVRQVDAESKQLKDQIDGAAKEKIRSGLNAQTVNAQASILKTKVDELASAKKAVIASQEYAKFLDQLKATADQNFGFAEGDLKAADQLARTQQEHRALQLQILDIVYEQKKYDLQILLAKQQLAHDYAAAADTQAAINQLPTQKAQAQQQTVRQTQGPLESYLDSIPHTAATINEALQNVAANGLRSFASGIADAAVNFKSLGSFGLSILKQLESQLIEMAVNKLFFNALGGLFGLKGGGGLGQTLFPIVNGVDPLAPLPARAGGGPVMAGQTYIVGENGPEIFTAATSGVIIPNDKSFAPTNARALSPMGTMQPGMVLIGVQANDYFDAQVMKVSGPVIAKAAVASANGGATLARQSLGRSAMHRLD